MRASAVRCMSCRITGPVIESDDRAAQLVDGGAWAEFFLTHSYHSPVVLVDVNRLGNPRLVEMDDAEALGAAPFVLPRMTEAQSEWVMDGLRGQMDEANADHDKVPAESLPNVQAFARAVGLFHRRWRAAHRRAWGAS